MTHLQTVLLFKDSSPNGFDYVIEATGAPAVCQETLSFIRRRGTLSVYGVYPENASVRFSPFDLFRGEISIKGSFAQLDSFPRALAYLESGRVKVNEIVTEELPLAEFQQALDLAWARKGYQNGPGSSLVNSEAMAHPSKSQQRISQKEKPL